MSKLQRVLMPYAPSLGTLGGAAEPGRAGSPTATLDRERIQADLRRCREWYERWFYVCAGAFLLLLALELTWAVMKRDDPAALQATMTAAGVGIMATVAGMVHLWKMKSRADIVVALLSGLEPGTLQAALAVLVPKL
jgi:hypothetical protein